jgi:membrane protein YdbS with pleckstrin-like domain
MRLPGRAGLRRELPPVLRKCLTKREKVMLATRRHWVRMVEPVLSALAAAVLALWHGLTFPDLTALTRVLQLAWVVLLVRVGWRYWLWRRQWFAVTNHRFLLLHGGLTITLGQLPLVHGRDLTLHQSLLGQWFGYGEFTLETAPKDHVLRTVRWLPDSERIYRRISHYVHDGGDDKQAYADAIVYGFDDHHAVIIDESSRNKTVPVRGRVARARKGALHMLDGVRGGRHSSTPTGTSPVAVLNRAPMSGESADDGATRDGPSEWPAEVAQFGALGWGRDTSPQPALDPQLVESVLFDFEQLEGRQRTGTTAPQSSSTTQQPRPGPPS